MDTNKTRRRAIPALLAVATGAFLIGSASAATVYWKDNAQSDDWTDGENYVGGTAPSANDTVVVGNATVRLSNADSASFSLASSLARIQPTNANAKIEFTIDGADATSSFGASIRYHETSDSDRRGTIVKKGAGRLELTCDDSTVAYATDMVVEQGVLSVANSGISGQNAFFGVVAVSNNASFFTRTTGRTWLARITGDGTVTNSSAGSQISIWGGSYADPVELTTWMSKLGYYSPGRVMIRRTDNTFGNFYVFSDSANDPNGRGVTGFYKIGKKDNPSSVGTGDSLRTGERGGTFLYLGDGNETETDKKIVAYYASQGATIFDAGAYDGLTFKGNWEYGNNDAVGQGMGQLVLTGSNTHECVISGSIKNATLANKSGQTGFSYHITKKGTGTWRFSDVGSKLQDGNSSGAVRENYTGIAVEEGTLRYDSIFEVGDKCSLGMATNLYEAYFGAYDEAYRVPYAFRLGSALRSYPDDALATFEYTGTVDAICLTRPIALGGDAKLLNSSAKPFRFSGISAISNGVQNLVLAGTGTDNEVANLTDGTAGGRLGVIKEGSGTWTLAMTNSFSGPVVVKGGTLKVRRTDSGTPYTWYKLVVKDLWSRFRVTTKTDYFKIGRIGLFDAEGYRQKIGFAKNAGNPVGASLNPGEIGRGLLTRYYTWYGNSYEKMTETGLVSDSSCLFAQRDNATIDPNDPKKWMAFEMRLTNGAPEIAYYDLAVVYGNGTGAASSNYNVRAWSLLGSTDGWNWDELHSVADSRASGEKMKIPNTSNSWMAQNKTTSGESAATKHDTTKLQAIRGHSLGDVLMPLANVEYVKVCDGGVLEADGDITLSSFQVEAGATAGTVRGFKLAQNCTVNVTGLPQHPEPFDLPIVFEGTSLSGSTYSLEIESVPTAKYSISAVGDRLCFMVKGTLFILR